jgi:hypothetical protein
MSTHKSLIDVLVDLVEIEIEIVFLVGGGEELYASLADFA